MQVSSLPDLDRALANARRVLLDARNADGYWVGELSSSALSTATAIFALSLHSKSQSTPPHPDLIAAGANWLTTHQNSDGGWGDTIKSFSNISTTALCWAALSAASNSTDSRQAVDRAEAWLTQQAGGIDPARLIPAIIRRYGKDHTFSVPILTMCALAGRLGVGRSAWKKIPQLPFELAAFPQRWFKWLKLPVVSYALPALIAIGLVRHRLSPTRNPIALLARYLAERRALRLLEKIQPTTGGYLEATPLTSFVVMSLVAAGLANHAVVTNGIAFLVRSARPDGSWAIDTNLATWVTTLAVNALALNPDFERHLPAPEAQRILDWLIDQQYKTEHPYTLADPGCWAWTDLSGGVPDADDTPGALLALKNLAGPALRAGSISDAEHDGSAGRTLQERRAVDASGESSAGSAPRAGSISDGQHDRPAVRALQCAAPGIQWLLNLQNRDGGIPTFCRGWGKLPFDRSSADLSAHTARAIVAWFDVLPSDMHRPARAAMKRIMHYLIRSQRADGAWIPLWFGNQQAAKDKNPTYGTAKVLCSANCFIPCPPAWDVSVWKAVRWLIEAQNPDGGWGGDRATPSSIEETALAIEALAHFVTGEPEQECDSAVARGVAWLIEKTCHGTPFDPSPIGFYFAKLWYFENLYPVIFTVAALGAVKRALEQREG
jgi:squalene-hopene/tetraprenyl-beta-curcumene cyclase